MDVAYSPDGRWLASAAAMSYRPVEPGEVMLWDAETGREIRTFAGHTAGVLGVAFSPDGRWLASGCGDGIVRIWDTRDPAGRPASCRGTSVRWNAWCSSRTADLPRPVAVWLRRVVK